jgi:hypothetical protein
VFSLPSLDVPRLLLISINSFTQCDGISSYAMVYRVVEQTIDLAWQDSKVKRRHNEEDYTFKFIIFQ